jgi:hypothetical protein
MEGHQGTCALRSNDLNDAALVAWRIDHLAQLIRDQESIDHAICSVVLGGVIAQLAEELNHRLGSMANQLDQATRETPKLVAAKVSRRKAVAR